MPNEKSVLLSPRPDLNLSRLSREQFLSTVNLAKNAGPEYGHTFADITHRCIPWLVLAAYPSYRITPNLALEVATNSLPTPPFKEA